MIPDGIKQHIDNEIDFNGWSTRKQDLFWLLCKYDYVMYREHWVTDSGDYHIFDFGGGRASLIVDFTNYIIETVCDEEIEYGEEDNLDDNQSVNGWNKIDKLLEMEEIGNSEVIGTIYVLFWNFIDATI